MRVLFKHTMSYTFYRWLEQSRLFPSRRIMPEKAGRLDKFIWIILTWIHMMQKTEVCVNRAIPHPEPLTPWLWWAEEGFGKTSRYNNSTAWLQFYLLLCVHKESFVSSSICVDSGQQNHKQSHSDVTNPHQKSCNRNWWEWYNDISISIESGQFIAD